MWLFSRWIVRALAAPKFFDSYEAVGLISTAVTLYALYMVLVVILGRTGRTEFNLPATLAALAANVALNLLLVPPLGIVGAGLALVASYLVVLALMYVFTQRLFPVPYQWGRLARVVLDRGGPGRRRRAADADLRRRSACSAAPPSSPPTPSPSSPAASSPPASASGSPACATPASWSPRSSACAAAAQRRRRPHPRDLRGRAHGRGRPPLTTPDSELHQVVDPRGGELDAVRAGSADSARSRIDSPRPGKSAWRAWAQ